MPYGHSTCVMLHRAHVRRRGGQGSGGEAVQESRGVWGATRRPTQLPALMICPVKIGCAALKFARLRSSICLVIA